MATLIRRVSSHTNDNKQPTNTFTHTWSLKVTPWYYHLHLDEGEWGLVVVNAVDASSNWLAMTTVPSTGEWPCKDAICNLFLLVYGAVLLLDNVHAAVTFNNVPWWFYAVLV